MKPKEGTILTVAKGVAEKAQTLAEETDDLEEFLPKLIEEAETVLARFRRTGTSGGAARGI